MEGVSFRFRSGCHLFLVLFFIAADCGRSADWRLPVSGVMVQRIAKIPSSSTALTNCFSHRLRCSALDKNEGKHNDQIVCEMWGGL